MALPDPVDLAKGTVAEPLFERLFESSPDGILVADGTGRIIRANGQAERMFGYGRGDLHGQPIEIVVPERLRDSHAFFRRDYIAKLRTTPGNISVESSARRKDGTEFPAEIIVTPVVEAHDGPLALAVVRDITERKRAQEALRSSEEHYRTLLENLPQKIFLKDKNSLYVSCNENFARDLKISPQELAGKTDLDLFPAALAETYQADDRRIIASGETEEIEEEYFVNGERKVVYTVKTPVKDASGNPAAVLGIFWDITERKKIEQELRDRERQLQSILDNSSSGIYLKDPEGRYLRANRQFAAIFGKNEEQVIGTSAYDLVSKEKADRLRSMDVKVLEMGLSSEFEEVVEGSDGPRTYISTKFPLLDATGRPWALGGIMTDITERKQAEEENRHLATFPQFTPWLVLEVGRNAEVLYINPAMRSAVEQWGIGDPHQLIPPHWQQRLSQIDAIEQDVVIEEIHLAGRIFEEWIRFLPQFQTLRIYAIDITERKRVEEALRDREQQLQSLLDNSPATISLKDPQGRYLRLNRHCGEALGASEEQIIGKVIHDLMPKELADAIRAHDLEVLQCGCAKQFEEVVAQKDGLHTYVAIKFPLLDSAGKPYAVCGISTDITERKKIEEELRKRELQLQSILDNSPAVIYIKDLEGRYLKVNRDCAKGLGASEEQIIGKSIHDFFPKALADSIEAHERKVIETRSAMQFEDVVPREGELHTTLAVKFPLFDSSGIPYAICGISTDITERKRTEEALRESEERFRDIAENIQDVFWISSIDFSKVLYVSPAYERTWGRRRQDLYEQPLDWLEGIHPEDRERTSQNIARALQERGTFDVEYRVIRPDGSIRFVHDRGFPVLDSNGSPYRLVGIAADITQRKMMEEALRAREEELQSILDTSPSAIYLKDRDGRYLKVNRAFERIFGLSGGQVIGKTLYDIIPKERADRVRVVEQRLLESGESTEHEDVIPQKDGMSTFISTKFPILDSSGIPCAIGGIMTDITERKQTESALLLEMTNVLVSNLDAQKLFGAVAAGIREIVAHDYATLSLYDPEIKQLRVQRLTTPVHGEPLHGETLLPIDGSPAGYVFSTMQPMVLNRMEINRFPSEALRRAELLRRWIQLGVKSACWLPLIHERKALGVLIMASEHEDAFQDKEVRLLTQVANQIAVALDNALAYRQIASDMDRLAQEKRYLEDELKTEYNFEEIIGESDALKRVLKKVETVAPADATVLLLGETGTGKEVIARAIHNLSPRRGGTFVKLNCAAIPAGLLESELFGHEKGAYTGAIARKIGRFEVANGGTLLLDEIGDIPLELQPKLLRALQEKEFERLGSTRTISSDVRVIAATNRDLTQMVRDGQFRRDLFYRVSVFPITIPPLRDRADDIPLLVHYFLQKHAVRSNKLIKEVPPEVMQALVRWHWPGNIRELENVIERAVILSPGTELRVPLSELRAVEADSVPANADSTLEDVEREHILQVLRDTKGVIGGPQGAAERLGLKRTTLNFKMKKLGITRSDI